MCTATIHAGTANAIRGGMLAVALSIVVGAYLFKGRQEHAVVEQFPALKLRGLPEFQGSYAEDTLWGTYRSGQYLGLRMRVPSSLLVGLMWFDPDLPNAPAALRHNAEDRDGLRKFGWEAHDGHTYGRQELFDQGLHLTAKWVKRQCAGCGMGGDWALRLSARQDTSWQPLPAAESQEERQAQSRVSLLLYIADEDMQNARMDVPEEASDGTVASGKHGMIGDWLLSLETSAGRVRHMGLATPHFHNLTDAVRQSLELWHPRRRSGAAASWQLPSTVEPGSNLAVVQVTATLPCVVDLRFLSGRPVAQLAGSTQQQAALSGSALTELFESREAAFKARFQNTFGNLEASDAPSGTQPLAEAALSNMLGSIGYFHGSSIIQLPLDAGQQAAGVPPALVDSAAAPLLTGVPSRSFFPRGFLWDEGFHQITMSKALPQHCLPAGADCLTAVVCLLQLLISKWDQRLSRNILAHWLDLMNSQGWIAREQILGLEARSRVPAEFMVQYPDSANPPTLFLVLSDMAKRAAAASQAGNALSPEQTAEADFLRAAYPRLQAWFQWFHTTQAGPVPGSYRWRGRPEGSDRELNPKTLTSGLDDFPRASHPSPVEQHVDLRCWMALASRTLANIGSSVGLPETEVSRYEGTAALLEDPVALALLHYDRGRGHFADFGNHTEALQLGYSLIRAPNGQPVGREVKRVPKTPGHLPQPQMVPHFGYVSLFPLLMQLLEADSPHLKQQLDLLRDPEQLWTPYGLRSLSKSSSLYLARNTEHDAPYWRGPIWFNINFLTLRALHHYSSNRGPHAALARRLHDELRRNLLGNLVRVYNETGFLWEHYDDTDGHGKGTHPFTGWTALLVLVAGASY